MAVGHGRQAIEPGVLVQKSMRQRVAVTGCDLRTPSVRHQTGQAQTTTDLQNALASDGAVRHALSQAHARGPQQTKQGPSGR